MAKVWGEPLTAKPWDEDRVRENGLAGVEVGDRVIRLDAGKTILAHTQEFIGGRAARGGGITTMMKARSSMGRCGILVCKCAGWGDVGYVNRWTMEVTNISRYAILLVVGSRVAQIVFLQTGPLLGAEYAERGAYQQWEELADVQRAWHPRMMLPKMRK